MEVMEYHYVCYKAPGKTSAGQAVRRLALWADRNQKIVILFPLLSNRMSIIECCDPDFATLKQYCGEEQLNSEHKRRRIGF